MTDVDDAVARLEALVKQQSAQIAALQQQQAAGPQPRPGALDAPPTCYPEGARPLDMRPAQVRRREMGIAKMRVLARTRGGIWEDDARVPRVYGHRAGDAMNAGCEWAGEDEFRPSCQRTCWTPEAETRFLYSLGLKDLAQSNLVPLTPKDPKDRDAILDLIGVLKGQATAADVSGHYPERNPTRDEVGTAQGAARARRAS